MEIIEFGSSSNIHSFSLSISFYCHLRLLMFTGSPFIRFCLIALLAFVYSGCKKHEDKPINPVDQLPPATQSGAQTLGFLLNGKPWKPAGNNGYPRLAASYDPFYKKGVMSVTCYRIFSDTDRQYFGFGIIDSMNFIKTPSTFILTRTGLLNADYASLSQKVDISSTDDTTYCTGSLTLTKFDTTRGIVAGTFTVTLASPSIDTIKITEGRFDVLF